MTTIVNSTRHGQRDKRFGHGDEIPPNLLSPEELAARLDNGEAIEYDSRDRRSLYRLFAPFSGCTEQESLTREELNELALL